VTRPTFLIVGAARCGTTSLVAYLSQHPDIFFAPRKETSFWLFEGRPPRFSGPGDDHFCRTVITERAAYDDLFRRAGQRRAIGEASVYYLHRPEVFERIAAVLPDVRVVAILRAPVERAYSAYQLLVREGRERVPSFSEALALEAARQRLGWEWAWEYRGAGFYAERMRHMLEVFGDRSLVLRTSDLEHQPLTLLRRAFEFLDVDPDFRPDVGLRHNQGGTARHAGVQRLALGDNRLARVLAPITPDAWKRGLWQRVVSANTVPVPMSVEDRLALEGVYDDDQAELAGLCGWEVDLHPGAGPIGHRPEDTLRSSDRRSTSRTRTALTAKGTGG
jgi:hypothetical protein